MSRWILDFSQYYPNIVINAPIVGSGAGPCLTNGTCDMSIIGREILIAEETPFIDKFGYKPFELPLAGGSYAALSFTDAMTVMVHPTNPLKQLTFAQFDAIYSTTRYRNYPKDIMTWDQLGLTGSPWTGQPIHLIGVQIPNGFENFFFKPNDSVRRNMEI
jgi:phosphate transport system substrate-binding protein